MPPYLYRRNKAMLAKSASAQNRRLRIRKALQFIVEQG
jgi:hypothetical protein